MDFKAIHNTVIVEILHESIKEETSAGGILIMTPQTNGLDVNTVRAKVVSVGEGKYHEKTGQHIPITLQVGDEIVMNGAVGAKLNEKLRVVGVDDIFAKIV
ncbi:hypothetical protein [Stenotrophomonas phage RAS14]